MNASAILAFAHHLAAFMIVAAITSELVLLDRMLSVDQARRIQRADMVYGLSAGALVVVGLLRVFYFEKGSAYYFHNVFFILKMSLFLLVALLSIYPTLLFVSWNKLLKGGRSPQPTVVQYRRLRQIIFCELLGIVGILLCAPLMARGSDMSE
jgi:putative membrane protein